MKRLIFILIAAAILGLITGNYNTQGATGDVKIPKIFEETDKNLLPGPKQVSGTLEGSYAIQKVVPWVVQFLLQLAAALAVVSIMLGGWYYMTAMGDDAQVNKAKVVITWAIIGLIGSILSYAIVDIVNSIKW